MCFFLSELSRCFRSFSKQRFRLSNPTRRYHGRVIVSLSNRAKQAIKTALAMVIAYAIALEMGWETQAGPGSRWR